MFAIAKRNLKIYFRDKSTVILSLLAVFIIIGLYVLFLKDIIVSGIDGWEEIKGIDYLLNSWVIAGILAVTPVTTTMSAYAIMVHDYCRKISKDFYSSPIKRFKLAGGYILSAYIIGVLMTMITFILGEIYIVATGGRWIGFINSFKMLILILISVLTSSSLMFFIVSFIKSEDVIATISTILGTLIGFITGVYIPIGSFPQAIQWVIKLFPVSHACALIRQVMMQYAIQDTFLGAEETMVKSFENHMGLTYKFGMYVTTPFANLLIMCLSGAFFYVLSLINFYRFKINKNIFKMWRKTDEYNN